MQHKLLLYRYINVTVKPEGMRSNDEEMQFIDDVQLVPADSWVIGNSGLNLEHDDYES